MRRTMIAILAAFILTAPAFTLTSPANALDEASIVHLRCYRDFRGRLKVSHVDPSHLGMRGKPCADALALLVAPPEKKELEEAVAGALLVQRVVPTSCVFAHALGRNGILYTLNRACFADIR